MCRARCGCCGLASRTSSTTATGPTMWIGCPRRWMLAACLSSGAIRLRAPDYGEETVRNGVDLDAVTSAADLAYPLENVEVRFVRRDPAGVPTGWWRGVGPTRSVFAVESFMDELAAAAQQDPVRYRRALLKDPRMRAVLDLAAD